MSQSTEMRAAAVVRHLRLSAENASSPQHRADCLAAAITIDDLLACPDYDSLVDEYFATEARGARDMAIAGAVGFAKWLKMRLHE